MGVIFEKPPIFDRVAKVFDIRGKMVVFAYGDNIYNPFRAGISDDLRIHEEVHMRQQKAIGGPEVWWDRYLIDAEFRLSQEIEAYQAQYKYFCEQNKDKNMRFKFLNKIAGDLSSQMYKVDIGFMEACKSIKGE